MKQTRSTVNLFVCSLFSYQEMVLGVLGQLLVLVVSTVTNCDSVSVTPVIESRTAQKQISMECSWSKSSVPTTNVMVSYTVDIIIHYNYISKAGLRTIVS